MKRINNFKRIGLLVVAIGLIGISVSLASTRFDYKFKVHNTTKFRITKIMVSEDGKKYGLFDIGDGIPAGATEEMVWDKSTDKGACEWYFKATFSDKTESEAAKFDFCEKDLVLEF